MCLRRTMLYRQGRLVVLQAAGRVNVQLNIANAMHASQQVSSCYVRRICAVCSMVHRYQACIEDNFSHFGKA
jgi:hypothetical protein